MHCPNCGKKQLCPCNSTHCIDKRHRKGKPWVWVNSNTIACAKCGLEESADWWHTLEFEIQQALEIKRKN